MPVCDFTGYFAYYGLWLHRRFCNIKSDFLLFSGNQGLVRMEERSRYQSMSVSDLKKALARLKASTKGRKPDLVAR